MIDDPVEAERLVRLHIAALFRVTAEGRLIESNETPAEPAPRAFLARSAGGVTCRLHRSLGELTARRIAELAAALPPWPESAEELGLYAEVEGALGEESPVASRTYGPAFRFPAASGDGDGDDRVVEIGVEKRGALQGDFATFEPGLEHIAPLFAVLERDRVVSACYCARRTEEAAEAGVDTDPRFRGRGYATAVVDAWRRAIEQSGRLPLYSTSFENRASRALAARLGLEQYAETLSLA